MADHVFEEAFDPSDEEAYTLEFPGLAQNEIITDFDVAVAQGAEWGVSVVDDNGLEPALVDENKAIQIYPAVAVEERGAARWRGFGKRVLITATVTTNASPPRTFQRSFALQVRQR